MDISSRSTGSTGAIGLVGASLRGDHEDRDVVAKALSAEGTRALLLFGEIGVGRTTLLRDGVIPLLRESGSLVLQPEPGRSITDGFAAAAQQATGEAARPDEHPREHLVRAITSRPDTMTVLVLDDLDLVLGADRDGSVAEELRGLVVRTTTMTRGQGRFLFTCADVRVHLIDLLERRTGTLLPPSARLRLVRLPTEAARAALTQALARAGTQVQADLVAEVLRPLDDGSGVLPAELGFLVRAIGALGLRDARDLTRLGTARPDVLWLERAAERTGDRAAALRVLAEVVDARAPVAAVSIALAADVKAETAASSLHHLVTEGVCRQVGDGFELSHEILTQRVRELAVPARREHAATRAMLAAAVARGQITRPELERVRAARIVNLQPGEEQLLAGLQKARRARIAAVAAVPVALVAAYFVLQTGSRHFATVGQRLVVRSGRAFLPGGSALADTGLSRRMLTDEAWRELGPVGDDYAARALAGLRPIPAAMRAYALGGDEKALERLRGELTSPDAWRAALVWLEPIARGTPDESALLRAALRDPATADATFALIARTAARRPGAYADLIAESLVSDDEATRRKAAAASAAFSPEGRAEVIAHAAAASHGAARAVEILGWIEREQRLPAPAVARALGSLLQTGELPPPAAERAWRLLGGLLGEDAAATAVAMAPLVEAKGATRERALALLLERAPSPAPPEVVAKVRAAAEAGVADAWPVFARLAPADAVALLGQVTGASALVRVAMAQAHGMLAAAHPAEAQVALDALLDSRQPAAVRAAAARAYGQLGGVGQDRLVLMAQNEGQPVGEAALLGLADSVLAGAGTSRPMSAIFTLWQRKGAAKRRATAAAVLIARKKPQLVADYLASAVYDRADVALHPVGADGLCLAAGAGSAKAFNTLVTAAGLAEPPTRARIAACVTSNADLAPRLAPRLATSNDPALRAAAATALGRIKGQGHATLLLKLAADTDGGVRRAAVAALILLGELPAKGAPALAEIWAAADTDERLGLLGLAETTGDQALVRAALLDANGELHRRAMRAAGALGIDVVEAELADPDPAVRREAVTLLAKASPPRLALLENASHDAVPDVAGQALRILGTQADPAALKVRIDTLLQERSEEARAHAVRLAQGLAARAPDVVIAALTPVLHDPAHDVRALAVRVVAEAQARKPATELAGMLRAAERDASARWVAVVALLVRAAEDRPGVEAALGSVVRDGPPFARAAAELALALVKSGADGATFALLLAP